MSSEWRPDGVELACAFVRSRTGVDGAVPLSAAKPARRRRGAVDSPQWSGSGPSSRDPVSAGSVVTSIVAQHDWAGQLAVHSVTGRWADIVGATIADHTRVETFSDGVLTVRSDATTWATQLRLLTPQLMNRLDEEVGSGVVTRIEVKGPAAPSWVHGPWRVKGRGPRDTYG